MILSKTISVWTVKSKSRSQRDDLPSYAASMEIQAGEEVKRFGEADQRGNVLIRWAGHTYLARENDLKPVKSEG